MTCQMPSLRHSSLEEENVSKRKPIPIEDIRTIQAKCIEMDDDMHVG